MSHINDPSSPPHLPRRGGKGDDPRMIGNWKIGRTIGKGSSGRVKIARHSKTGQYAAIKIVSKTSLVNSRLSLHDLSDAADRILLSIEREIVIMKLIDHPSIMRLYDVWETSGELYLILEYVEGGELFDYLCNKGRLPTAEALNYFQQIISAIDYCHRFNIAHRDLKPENLLLDSKRNIKVADFGMAAWQGTGDTDMLETACGSPHYAAPEVIRGELYDGSSSDIWSCGVILFALLAGRLPFDDENIHVLLEKVKVAKFVMPEGIDNGAQDLISKMLEKDVTKRITMREILEHPWYTSQAPSGIHLPPPSLEEIARPVPSASQIDADIFGNLRTLWHGAPDEDIIEGLTNDKQTWEKGVYHLLVKYRNRHLEDYKGDDDEDRQRKRPARTRSNIQPPPTPPVLKYTVSQLSELSEPPLAPPARPDPPTPRRASLQNNSPIMEISICKGSLPVPLLVRDNDPTPLEPPLVTPLLNRCSSTHTDLSSSVVSPKSPIPDALAYPPVDVSELQDENVQRFFQQIVEHLHTMEHRPSVIFDALTTGTPNTSASPNPTGTGKYHPFKPLSNANVNVPPPTPANDSFNSDDFLVVDYPEVDTITATQKSVAERKESRRSSPADTRGLGFLTISGPQKLQPRPTRPISRIHSHNKWTTNSTKGDNGCKKASENGMLHDGHDVAKKSSLRSNGDSTRKTALADRRVQIVLPPQEDHVKSRRKVSMGPYSPTLSNDSVFFPSLSTPKRSWFSNLFKFKPGSYQIISTHDITTTQEECHQLLVGLGVKVVQTQSEGLIVLKCKLDEIRDPAGVMAVVKAVQFRIELQAPSSNMQLERVAGDGVCVTMVQEKGALSSFKLLYNRLRREWDTDTPRTPLPLVSPVLTTGGDLQRFFTRSER